MAINNRYSFEFKQNNGGGGGNKTTTPTTKVKQPTIGGNGIKANSVDEGSGGSLIDSGTTTTNTYTNPYENLTRPTYNDTYEKQYLEYLQNSKDNQQTYLDELKESLKHSSYTDLLRSNVALSNARDTALSHTNTAMTAMGYGSQGYGSTNYSRQQNAYLNALGQNRSAYADRNAEIEQSYQSSMLDAQKNYDEMYLSYLDRLSSNARDEYLAELNNYYNQLNQKNEWDREDYENSLLEEDVANDDLYNSILNNMETAHTSDEKLNNYLTQIGATITDGKVNFDGISGLTNDQKTMLEQRYYAILNGEEVDNGTTFEEVLKNNPNAFGTSNEVHIFTSGRLPIGHYYNENGQYISSTQAGEEILGEHVFEDLSNATQTSSSALKNRDTVIEVQGISGTVYIAYIPGQGYITISKRFYDEFTGNKVKYNAKNRTWK